MRCWIARITKKTAKMFGSLGIFLCVVFSASATSGRLNQVYCSAYCTGPWVSPALQFYTKDKVISTLATKRIYSVQTTHDRNAILHVQDMVESDEGICTPSYPHTRRTKVNVSQTTVVQTCANATTEHVIIRQCCATYNATASMVMTRQLTHALMNVSSNVPVDPALQERWFATESRTVTMGMMRINAVGAF
ncbi:hypothetical protein DPMN_186720 [Dreissena polymorpha]|uniref:Uncharacterized protein n=1 Tax=Dreissena polymorpha TaxID=45954 RepID=A0A9D4I8E9_DREPO|nr:hypothetical protein DPMN_186720 [Dreissena polymorpha]